jgi:queuine/archaeosine tRNA-ribosyltransferase
MPVGWRHRQVMRAAMAKRRDWRERRAFMLFSPHEEHAFRRSMRQMVREQRQAIVDGMMSACRTAWEESCE